MTQHAADLVVFALETSKKIEELVQIKKAKAEREKKEHELKLKLMMANSTTLKNHKIEYIEINFIFGF